MLQTNQSTSLTRLVTHTSTAKAPDSLTTEKPVSLDLHSISRTSSLQGPSPRCLLKLGETLFLRTYFGDLIFFSFLLSHSV